MLDSYAVLAFLEDEIGGEIVNQLLQSPGAQFYISAINMGEIFYILVRERGIKAAELVESELSQAHNIRVVEATWELAKMAALFKSSGGIGISYADCFAAALAIEKDAPLITGDNEFKQVNDKLQIIWLNQKNDQLT